LGRWLYCRVSADDQSQVPDLSTFAKRWSQDCRRVPENDQRSHDKRNERAKVPPLAGAREIDAGLATGPVGSSTQSLFQSLDDLHGWKVSILAQTVSASI